MLTLLEIIKRSTEYLEKHGVEGARHNTELLVGHALGLKRMQLYLQFERPLTEAELERIRPLIRRRGNREPLQHILGTVEFHGLTLKVDRRALIPRPETELLVELILRSGAPAAPGIIDLGTGTGAIALALAKECPDAAVTAVDRSAEALALARENAVALALDARIRFLQSDWFAGVPGTDRFGLIVSNPPYLTEDEARQAEPEVRDHEPREALTPGPAGTEALVRLIRESHPRLSPSGLLALETGIAQHAALMALAQECGYARVESRPDLTGRDRYLFAWV